MSRQPFAERAYRSLLAAYPREFRDEFRDDMVLAFRHQCADESTSRAFGRAILDLLLTVPHQHLESHMNRNPTPAVTLAYLAVALGGLLSAVIVGAGTLSMVVGLSIAAIAGALAATTWRRAAPLRKTAVSAHWWHFIVAGAALIAAVIVGAEVGVDVWYLAFAAVVAAIALMVVGIGLGVTRLVTRRPAT